MVGSSTKDTLPTLHFGCITCHKVGHFVLRAGRLCELAVLVGYCKIFQLSSFEIECRSFPSMIAGSTGPLGTVLAGLRPKRDSWLTEMLGWAEILNHCPQRSVMDSPDTHSCYIPGFLIFSLQSPTCDGMLCWVQTCRI